MMWFKKIVRAILALLPVFGVVFLTTPTHAYKYPINVIPINVPFANGYYGQPTSNYGFNLQVSKDINYEDYLARVKVKYFSGDNFPADCVTDRESFIPIQPYNPPEDYYDLTWGIYGFTPNQPLPDNWNVSPCLDVTRRVPWSGFYREDVNDENGLYVQTKFDLSSIFGYHDGFEFPNKIYQVRIPLGSQSQSSIDNATTNSTFDFSGEFVYDFEDPANSGLSDQTEVNLSVHYTHSDGRGESTGTTCSYTLGKDNPSDPNSVSYLRYNCHYQIESLYFYNDPLLSFQIIFTPEYINNNTKMTLFTFDSSSVVTDGDFSTPPDEWGDQHIYGTDPDQAPGSAKQAYFPDIESDGINWSQSLINLFSFNILNPFAPLFTMFSGDDSCASIPTLAGLIHSEETQVCHWFPSSVRTIVTPVLSLASMMLLFGFAVRWLGSRSGNFVEDAGGVDSGGLHFQNKYRRNK